MDGKQLLRQLRDILNESSTSGWMDDFTSYTYLWNGATEFASRTQCFKSTVNITLVANVSQYLLPADFLNLYAKNDDNDYFLFLDDGTGYKRFMFYKDHNDILYQQNTSTEFPYNFTVVDSESDISPISGTASSSGTALVDAAGDFTGVTVGDTVHNVTDGSAGIVTAYISSTQLTVPLFGGTNDTWAASDAYEIVPQGRTAILVDPPPSVSAYTVTVPYIQRPTPVFSDYTTYRFQHEYMMAIIMYAAWLYKYRDSKVNEGDRYFQHFDVQVKKYSYGVNQRLKNNRRMRVNMKVRQ